MKHAQAPHWTKLKMSFSWPRVPVVGFYMVNFVSKNAQLEYRSKETELQEVKKVDPTNTNYIKTDFNQEQKAFGAFQNVFLSNKELSNLKTILSNQLENYIQRLSSYLKSTGRTYEDHEATILSWFYKDQGQQTRSEKSNIPSLEEYERGEHL